MKTSSQLEAMVRARIVLRRLQDEHTCRMCGACCRELVSIQVYADDIEKIAQFLDMTPKSFESKHIKRVSLGKVLKRTRPCEFLDNSDRCRIYEVRPEVCRRYPFLTGDVVAEVVKSFLDPIKGPLFKYPNGCSAISIVSRLYEKFRRQEYLEHESSRLTDIDLAVVFAVPSGHLLGEVDDVPPSPEVLGSLRVDVKP